jgi:hypothetical protein
MDQRAIDQIKAQRDALAAENNVLREALDEISDHAPWGGTKDKHIAWMQNIAIAALTKEATK